MEKIIVQVDADLEDLIPGYLENRQVDISNIREALVRGDYDSIRILGHTMKGTGGGYGFDTITDIGHALELAALQKNSQEIRQGVDELADYLYRLQVVYK
jgi:HPt (histidine-containing phosphotransfer) domain-containing protein